MRPTDSDEGEALLLLALSRPGRALVRATAVLAAQETGPCLASAALQARGIVLRDRGETVEAIRELRRALTKAARCEQPGRAADVRASLGAALVMHGRTELGLAELGRAAQEVHGAARATVLLRRAYVLSFLGRPDDALEDLRIAVTGFRRAGDTVWEARTLNNRASILMALGEIGRAERNVRRAEDMFAAAGQQMETVLALHNRATLAYLRGDLPRAFALYDRAAVAYSALETRSADLIVDRAQAYLAAGLTRDAVALTTQALGEPLQARHRAEVQLMAATSALADGDADSAEAVARRARQAFARQGRTFWVTRCELVAAQARYLAGRTVRLPALRQVAAALVSSRAEEAASALLLAGRVAAERGADGHAELAAAARYRRSSSPQVRATGWLALAIDRDRAGDGAGVLRATRHGLDALTAHRDVLGSTQLRALATRNTAELTTLALRHVLASGDARALLIWTERTRAAALARPAVRPPQDPALAAQLAAMRAVARALDAARDRGTPTAELTARLARLETAIDQRQRRASSAGVGDRPGRGQGAGRGRGGDLSRLVEALADRVLVELVDVEDQLHAVVLHRGRVRRVPVGSTQAALGAVQRARFALRQAARGRPTDLAGPAQQLERAVLGEARTLLGAHSVVVVPPARLHHTPWALCPALAARPVTSSPSAARWRAALERARHDPQVEHPTTALIAGPGLAGADEEVAELAAGHPEAVVLRGADATVAATLAVLSDAAVVHVAAHGRHRTDNPLFSSLQLADGPLTVHDLEALPRSPRRIVLSACDSGVMAAVGSDALLGLAEALLAQGTAGLVCTVSEVNDEATHPLMAQVHVALARGLDPAEALLASREAARGDLLATATAASFTSLGA